MKKSIKKLQFKKTGTALLVLVLMLFLGSCTLITNLAGLIIHSATDTLYNFIASYFDTTDPDNAIYGSSNDLSVGFDNGNMVAFWDDYGDYSYCLQVDKSGAVNSYDIDAKNCELDLASKGYSYTDDLSLSLYGINSSSQDTLLVNYIYDGITDKEYQTYTANMSGGWTDLDRYIATRLELFEMFNYIIIFQPDMTVLEEGGNTYYCSEVSLFLGYDYLSIYPEGTKVEDAYSTEIASAISAFDDSAGYNYSHKLQDNYVECSIFLRFSYQSNPIYTTNTNTVYKSENYGLEVPHYNLAIPRQRNFEIDRVEKTVTVQTTDQLYFALKQGYRPLCLPGSNAEYIYNHMRIILSKIVGDITPPDVKMHYIYDYIVDTVIYDYVFTESILNNDESNSPEFFLYKCLYLEGVFGFTNEQTFDDKSCVAICDGIAKAILCMCTIEGIPTIKVSGTSNGVAHAWNKVNIKDDWYLVDATWGNERKENLSIEVFSHDFLMVADDPSHIEDKWIDYPSARFPYNR
ncbi:MAG TPA: hypothetical protein VJ903_02870 [Clostridia bacterium]|nr:hypothetical protein [Clostridia bacterium]